MRRITKRKLNSFRLLALVSLFLLALVTMSIIGYAFSPVQVSLPISQYFIKENGDTHSTRVAVDYILSAPEENTPLPEGSTGTSYRFSLSGNQPSGTVSITFNRAGIFNYELTEAAPSDFSYRWNHQTYYITVYVKDDSSTMIILNNSEKVKIAKMSWTYTYIPQPKPTTPDREDNTEATKPTETSTSPTQPTEPTAPTAPTDPTAPTSTVSPSQPTFNSRDELENYLQLLQNDPVALSSFLLSKEYEQSITNIGGLARTGDDSNAGLLMILALLSGFGIVTLGYLKFRGSRK